MAEVKVSVITVCYNSAKTIERTIRSVLAQTHPVDEYFIIDGASTDETMEIVRRYEKDFAGRMHVVSERDGGIYDAMNKGISLSTGKLIGIINSDDFYEETAVADILDAYDNQEYAVLYGEMRVHSADGTESVSFGSHLNLEKEMINHPTCFVTRAAYDRFGMFDLQYCSVADYDLMLRYSRQSEITFIPIRKVIANFTAGGMCSSQRAYFDLLKMEVNYGWKTRREAMVLKMKAKLSSYMNRHFGKDKKGR